MRVQWNDLSEAEKNAVLALHRAEKEFGANQLARVVEHNLAKTGLKRTTNGWVRSTSANKRS